MIHWEWHEESQEQLKNARDWKYVYNAHFSQSLFFPLSWFFYFLFRAVLFSCFTLVSSLWWHKYSPIFDFFQLSHNNQYRSGTLHSFQRLRSTLLSLSAYTLSSHYPPVLIPDNAEILPQIIFSTRLHVIRTANYDKVISRMRNRFSKRDMLCLCSLTSKLRSDRRKRECLFFTHLPRTNLQHVEEKMKRFLKRLKTWKMK